MMYDKVIDRTTLLKVVEIPCQEEFLVQRKYWNFSKEVVAGVMLIMTPPVSTIYANIYVYTCNM